MLILAAGLLYGDGLITPAISILSAVEGLEYMTEGFKPYVMWIAAGIVLALFAVQRTGHSQGRVVVRLVHGAVARQYRPVWGGSGLAASADSPGRQPRVWPHLSRQPGLGPTVWWSSDLSCWRSPAGKPCMRTWGTLVVCRSRWAGWGLPTRASCSTTLGKAPFCSGSSRAGSALPDTLHVFYATFNAVVSGTGPLILMVSLATMATIIASQALISGAYSLTAQAIALGYGGRMDDYPHEHGTCGADLYANAQLAALCRVCGADL